MTLIILLIFMLVNNAFKYKLQSSRYSNATTVNTNNESHVLTRHLSFKSVEQAFDKSSNSYKASIISNFNNTAKKSINSDAQYCNEPMSNRHQSNTSSIQSGILSNASSRNGIDFKSRNQSKFYWHYAYTSSKLSL